MIINVPTPEELNKAALTSYFKAWSQLLHIATDFDEVYPRDSDWSAEKAEYLEGCQSDLQTCCTFMQQANELALKARIAEISPFLLLFRNDRKLSLKADNLDFSDLRTLDAYDLPRAVNSFCTRTLSDGFVADYERVRKLRNKIIHLGVVDQQFEPDGLLKLMIGQFIELWPDRGWLAERYNYAKSCRHAFFHDGRHSSAEGDIFFELDDTLGRFGKSEFKKLIGFAKNSRRYLCPLCLYNSEARSVGLDLSTCKTAFMPRGENAVRCAMCQGMHTVVRGKCGVEDCQGSAFSDENDDQNSMCLTCGEYADR